MLITEELIKEEIIYRMKAGLEERKDIEELIDKEDIIVKSTSCWYFSENYQVFKDQEYHEQNY
jgi:hypothetical protein